MVLIFDPIRNRNVNITNEYGAPARRLYRIYINDLNQYQHNILPRDYYYNEETDSYSKNKYFGKPIKEITYDYVQQEVDKVYSTFNYDEIHELLTKLKVND